MIINGADLFRLQPIVDMIGTKEKAVGGTSYGLSESGYDIRLAESIWFYPVGTYGYFPVTSQNDEGKTLTGFQRKLVDKPTIVVGVPLNAKVYKGTNFVLGSSMEQFDMPNSLLGRVGDKSTWARKGVSVFNTHIKPGWKGTLTLELVFHGAEAVCLPAGCGVAEIIFEQVLNPAKYEGPYQNQEAGPVGPKRYGGPE